MASVFLEAELGSFTEISDNALSILNCLSILRRFSTGFRSVFDPFSAFFGPIFDFFWQRGASDVLRGETAAAALKSSYSSEKNEGKFKRA